MSAKIRQRSISRKKQVTISPRLLKSAKVRNLASKIAVVYLRQLKSHNLHSRPWAPGSDIEDLPQFVHFLRVARIVLDSQKDGGAPIDYRDFVTAQFEAWNGPARLAPMLTQLYSEGAFVRYQNWLDSDDRRSVPVAVERAQEEQLPPEKRFKGEIQHLARLVKVHGVSERRILVRMCTDFSEEFLRWKKAWKKVQKRYLAWKEEE
jgi:hypothetical protein